MHGRLYKMDILTAVSDINGCIAYIYQDLLDQLLFVTKIIVAFETTETFPALLARKKGTCMPLNSLLL